MAQRTASKCGRVGFSVGVAAGLLLAGLVALMGTWFVGMRTKWRPVIDLQRRVNKSVFNPRQMRTAGSPGAYAAVIRHTGRRSGQRYETPVVPLPTDGGVLVVLPYGTRPDWVKNVLAAGTAELVHEGETYTVDSPVVRTIEPGDVPASEQRALRLFGNTECMVLHRVEGVAA